MSVARIVLISRPNPIPFQPRALEGIIATVGRAAVGGTLRPWGTLAREPFGAANGIGSASPLSPNAHRDVKGEDPLPVPVGSRLSSEKLAKSGRERKSTSCSPLNMQRFDYQIDVPIPHRRERHRPAGADSRSNPLNIWTSPAGDERGMANAIWEEDSREEPAVSGITNFYYSHITKGKTHYRQGERTSQVTGLTPDR